ncbi:MAG: ArnT family glycosyltransferase [Prochlorococcus sp.]
MQDNGAVLQVTIPSSTDRRHTRAWLMPLLLWGLTLAIWLPWLGNLPLRDWDEGLVATVARSTAQQHGISAWLALKWDHIYLNKPPGLHWLIGRMLQLTGDSETSVRAVPGLLASLSIPLLVGVRRQLEPLPSSPSPRGEIAAGLSAAILMTLLPVARHGRLVMLDGALMSSSLMLCWGWLSLRHNNWRALLAGLGGSGVLMLKPPALLGFLLVLILISSWDWLASKRTANPATTKLENPWKRSLLWLTLGLSPGLSWHLFHLSQRGADALVMWGGHGLARITSNIDQVGGSPLTPLIEICEGGWPWLVLLPVGLGWAWHQRHHQVGRWELGLLLGSAAMVLPLRTQLPWYSQLLWPPIALLCGEALAELIESRRPLWVSRIWQLLGVLLLIGTGVATAQMLPMRLPISSLGLAGLGLLLGSIGLRSAARPRRWLGLTVIVLGWSLALLTLWHSKLWLWELNESWDPRPVAMEIRQLPKDAQILLDGPNRPSLGWYAGRELQPYNRDKVKGELQYWLVSPLQQEFCRPASETGYKGWQLWRCSSRGEETLP